MSWFSKYTQKKKKKKKEKKEERYIEMSFFGSNKTYLNVAKLEIF